jgi:hypothetical protein
MTTPTDTLVERLNKLARGHTEPFTVYAGACKEAADALEAKDRHMVEMTENHMAYVSVLEAKIEAKDREIERLMCFHRSALNSVKP